MFVVVVEDNVLKSFFVFLPLCEAFHRQDQWLFHLDRAIIIVSQERRKNGDLYLVLNLD